MGSVTITVSTSAVIAGRTSPAVSIVAAAVEAVAQSHPHLYRLMNAGPLPRHLLTPGVEERTAAPLLHVLPQPDLARAAFAFAHGMTMLELDDRFPPGADIAAAWRAGTQALQAAM